MGLIIIWLVKRRQFTRKWQS